MKKINNRIKRDFSGDYGKIDLRVLKIPDTYLMKKMSLHMKISSICLITVHLNQ